MTDGVLHLSTPSLPRVVLSQNWKSLGFDILLSPKPNCPSHFLPSSNNRIIPSHVGARKPCKTAVKIIHSGSSAACDTPQSLSWPMSGNEELGFSMETSALHHMCVGLHPDWTYHRSHRLPEQTTGSSGMPLG